MSRNHWPHEEDGQAPIEQTAKADSFWTLLPKPTSDKEFVEQLRKSSESFERWKWMGLLFVAVSLVAIWHLTNLFVPPIPNAPPGMVFDVPELMFYVFVSGLISLIVGVKIGHSFHSLTEILLGDRRTDLLIRYHDLLDEHNLLNQTTSTLHDSAKHTDHTT